METREKIRRPAVADRFYPGDPRMLARDVDRYLQQAAPIGLRSTRAVVAPHAAYACSGSVAGFSFRALQEARREPTVVYLLGPAHWGGVAGAGLPRSEVFETPLGPVEVAKERRRTLSELGVPFEWAEASHAPEHCLEVELPFLQRVFSSFRIVPLLLGSNAPIEAITDALAPLLEQEPSDVVVVSSDLSHHLPDWDARRRDRLFLQDVLGGRTERLEAGQACGLCGILVLMRIADRLGWTPHLLAYANSGETCGPKSSVVGYASLAFTA